MFFNQSWHLEHNLFCRILRLTQGIFGSQMDFLNCWAWFFYFFANHCTECRGSQNPDSSSNNTVLLQVCIFYYSILGKKTGKFSKFITQEDRKKVACFIICVRPKMVKEGKGKTSDFFFSNAFFTEAGVEYGVVFSLKYFIAK